MSDETKDAGIIVDDDWKAKAQAEKEALAEKEEQPQPEDEGPPLPIRACADLLACHTGGFLLIAAVPQSQDEQGNVQMGVSVIPHGPVPLIMQLMNNAGPGLRQMFEEYKAQAEAQAQGAAQVKEMVGKAGTGEGGVAGRIG